MTFAKKIKLLATIVAIAAIYIIWDAYRFMHAPMLLAENEIVYSFTKGSSASRLINDLHAQSMIDKPFYLKLWGRVSGKSKKLQAGEYVLQQGITPYQLFEKMSRGDVRLYAFTIIEGWNYRQLFAAIQQDGNLQHTLSFDNHEKLMQELGYPGQHPEGQFFPDTYRFPAGTTDKQFLQRAYDQMHQVLQEQWNNRAKGLPLKTAYEALTLASIVEKESAAAKERPLIAGVFINRLNKNMRLQTDPTVIYGIGEKFDGDIRFRHLREDTPYNTYTRKGLPPTPIAMPGLEAIHAALNPAPTEYLYFVATGSNGEHYFSSTNEEHQRAVTKYQRYLRKKKQK